jgi:hypothetical protein
MAACQTFLKNGCSGLRNKRENVLDIQVHERSSLVRESLARLSGHFIAQRTQDGSSRFDLAPRDRRARRL